MPVFEKSEIDTIVKALRASIKSKPLRLGIIGVSGVGKSSTVNALFNSTLAVSHTIACTKEFTTVPIAVDLKIAGDHERSLLHVVDAPGLGESLAADRLYLEKYRQELPACDAVLWLMAARNRGMALDQMYLSELVDVCPNIVFGLNQVDLVEPRNWSERLNLPSDEQLMYITEIENDRRSKLEEVAGREISIVSFSAARKYRLSELFAELIRALPEDRRALYDLVRGFRPEQQFDKEVLLKAQRLLEVPGRGEVKRSVKENTLACLRQFLPGRKGQA